MVQTGASAAHREGRVFARGRSSRHATSRSLGSAAAVATCCPFVWAAPHYRAYRRPELRTACANVPSPPARGGDGCLPASLLRHARAACTAAYCGRGGRPRRWPCCCARVQRARAGHAWPSSRAHWPQSGRPLVGRDAPLRMLREHLARALDGVRQNVWITGEVGIGKTALIDAFLGELDAHSPAVARGQAKAASGRRAAR